jgi:hypothetical protein
MGTLTQTYNLAVVNPLISREWHPIRNVSLTPQDVTARSGKKIWWKCSKGYEWQAIIESRSAGNGCPYCAGRLK